MRSSNFSVYATLALSVSALPNQLRKRDWTNPEGGGNVVLTWSDETIRIGTVKLDDMIGKLADACATSGQCDTNTQTLQGQLVEDGNGSVDDITVSMNPDGAYPTWIRNGLIDVLHAALAKVADCKDVTNTPTCPNPMSYCPAEPFTVNECTVPRFWGINYQADPDAAPPFISTNVDMKVNSDGFCSTFTTIGGGIAAAVNGVAAGAFTLASLACKS